jgi:hypothetical protein
VQKTTPCFSKSSAVIFNVSQKIVLSTSSVPLRLNSSICIAGSGYCSVLCSGICRMVGGARGKLSLKRSQRLRKQSYNISLICHNSVLSTCETCSGDGRRSSGPNSRIGRHESRFAFMSNRSSLYLTPYKGINVAVVPLSKWSFEAFRCSPTRKAILRLSQIIMKAQE